MTSMDVKTAHAKWSEWIAEFDASNARNRPRVWALLWHRVVSKHEHPGYPPGTYPCDKPWTALCQADLTGFPQPSPMTCWFEDHETQPEALQALLNHIQEGSCDTSRDRTMDTSKCTIPGLSRDRSMDA